MPPLLELRNVGKTFSARGKDVVALDGVQLSVDSGECHAIVGESGSGKTTLGNIVLGLLAPTFGVISYDSEPLPALRTKRHKREIQLVQQNPLSSLNPRRSVGASVRLPLDVHDIGAKAAREERVETLLAQVGLASELAKRSPRGLSGGERQRVAIARALACGPKLIVLDEPTSALDVIVQARVLALLDHLRKEHNLTYLFITHDLAVVRTIADRVSVFQKGRCVETGTVDQVFRNPTSSYTRELIRSVPVITDEEATMLGDLQEAVAT